MTVCLVGANDHVRLTAMSNPTAALHSVAILTIALSGQSAPAGELLKNPGFEDQMYTQPGLHKRVPVSWSGSWKSKGEVSLVEDEPLCRSGRHCVKLAGMSIHQEVKPIEIGKPYHCRVWVKGQGKARCMFYRYGVKADGKQGFLGSIGWKIKPLPLTDEWQLFSTQIEFTDPHVRSIAVAICGGPLVYADDASFTLAAERSLLERVTDSRIEKERGKHDSLFKRAPQIREKLGDELALLHRELDDLKANLRGKQIEPEEEFDLERRFQAIQERYEALAVKLAFEEVLQ